MRIKKFIQYINESQSDKLYVPFDFCIDDAGQVLEIDDSEYPMMEFTDKEFDKIDNEVKRVFIRYSIDEWILNLGTEIEFNIINFHKYRGKDALNGYLKIHFWKSEDKYYYVELNSGIKTSKLYKCDDMEGVLQLIGDIENIFGIKESVSGTELIGHMGPNYGEEILSNTLSISDTNLMYIGDKIYTEDEYYDLYREYLTKGGTPLNGVNKENLEKILYFN